MEFHLGIDQPNRRVWTSDCANYRITYLNTLPECNGYRPAYYAAVKMRHGDREVWTHAHKHGPFWSYAAAEKACKCNRRHWRQLMKAKSANEARHLIEKSRVGLRRDGHRSHQTARILGYPPIWVEERIPRRLRRLLPGNRPRTRKKVAAQ